MKSSANLNVVHESEAQRQYARVRLPAVLVFEFNGLQYSETVIDISAGGFSLSRKNIKLNNGASLSGELKFKLEEVTFSIDVNFQVVATDAGNERQSCEFHNLGNREISSLRYLITSYLGGELVTIGDMISTLQRDNFTKARKKGDTLNKMSAFQRLKAVSVSFAVFVLGLGAFGYVATSLHDHYFVTRADSAMVDIPATHVIMPREGTIQSLVPEDGLVKKGAPIAQFSTTLLDVMKGQLGDDLNADKLEQMVGRKLNGTISSPCDCLVVEQIIADGQYAGKGARLFKLIPANAQATVVARFPYHKFEEVKVGTEVDFEVSGIDASKSGRVVSVSLIDEGLTSDIRVSIETDEPLSSSFAGHPVAVKIKSMSNIGIIETSKAETK